MLFPSDLTSIILTGKNIGQILLGKISPLPRTSIAQTLGFTNDVGCHAVNPVLTRT